MANTDLKANSLLLTGANGFLGSAIVKRCAQAARSVRCVGRQQRSDLEDYAQLDLVSAPIPSELFKGINTVIHAVGLAHQFGAAANNANAFDQINRATVDRMMTAAAANGVAHFVLISSSGVYGPTADFPTEDAPCNPQGHYGCSKLAGEQTAIEIARDKGIRLTVARMTTLYGANDRGNLNRLIQAIARKRFLQIGSCANRKNLIHKDDAAAACLLLADAVGAPIEIYNVGISPVTMREVLNEIVSALQIRHPVKVPAVSATIASKLLSVLCGGKGPGARIHHSIKTWLRNDDFDTAKFQNTFSFEPEVSLSAGIEEQVTAYQSSSNNSAQGG